MSRILSCPRCHESAQESLLALGMGSYVKCQHCNLTFCSLTGREWKAPHDPRVYKFAFLQDSLMELEKNFDKEKIAQCPGCWFPKVSEGSEDGPVVTCSTCSVSFCVHCCAPFAPILVHGLSYHRPSCPLYTATHDDATMDSSCPECQKATRRCDPPSQLKTPRRFEIDEH